MKKFIAKIIVNIKPQIKDIKGITLKQAAVELVQLENLSCRVGNFYTFSFSSKDVSSAETALNKIAQEILSNDVIETYEILSLEEANEKN